jgi:uncharacterized pyridoxamine 5'-phosphate oxidase family protein
VNSQQVIVGDKKIYFTTAYHKMGFNRNPKAFFVTGTKNPERIKVSIFINVPWSFDN